MAVNSVCWIFYDILTGAWVNIMTNGMVLGSILVGMVRLDRKPKS